MKPSSSGTRLGLVVVLVLLLRLPTAPPAAAVRLCIVDVVGTARTAGEATLATERGRPNISPVDFRSLAIAKGTTSVQASAALANGLANPKMIGVLSAKANGSKVEATLEDNASMAVFETQEIEGMFFSRPGCNVAYGGDPPKARVTLSVTHIRVPEGDRTPRQFTWTVRNISSHPLPGDFLITWHAVNLDILQNKTSGNLLFNLPPGQKVAITSTARLPLPNQNGLERGWASPRSNGDPALDDPEKPPVMVDEGVGDCIRGTQPSATLLVPYFEVDLESPSGPTTLLAVTNQSEECVPVRMMLWSDWGVPTLTSYLFLSPDDVHTINLRDVFNGKLPDTSATLADPACESAEPPPCERAEIDTEITNLQLQSMRAIHVGLRDPVTDLCAGSDRGDGMARGYVTIDVLRSCTYMPTTFTWARPEWQDPEGFFAATDTGFRNVLWGDYFLVDPGNDFAQGETAVHIPAEPDLFLDGDYTFYGRYTGFDASDGRVPLSSRYRTRFLSGGPFDGGTRLHVWRDDRSPVQGPVPCGTRPASLPLGDQGVTAYDENEASVPIPSLATLCPVADEALAFTCLVPPGLGPGINFGFLDLALGAGTGSPAQAWVSPVMNAEGRYSVAFEATRVDDLCHVPGRAAVVP